MALSFIRGDSAQKKLALVFTGDEFADGGNFIAQPLEQQKKALSFLPAGFIKMLHLKILFSD